MRIPAHTLFYPAAAAYAALVVPASVASMLGTLPAIPGLAFPAGHAHELVFGFALAAVAGNQLGPTLRATLAMLFGAWVAARIGFLLAPRSVASAAANGAFALLLAALLAPRLLGRAKKWRNRALPAALLALCASAVAIQGALLTGSAAMARPTLLTAILVLSLLMLFMGGRIIAPAAAGQAYRQGGNLAARVQPRIEAALIAAMTLAIAASAAGFSSWAGAAAMLAGLLAAIRMWRWRLWRLRGRTDLLCLAAGYAWLAVGLAGTGAAAMAGRHLVAALHLVTVGAIGTLTINVMALTYARLARRDPARDGLPAWSTALIAVATVARAAVELLPAERVFLLWTASSCWCAAYLLLALSIARNPRPSGA